MDNDDDLEAKRDVHQAESSAVPRRSRARNGVFKFLILGQAFRLGAMRQLEVLATGQGWLSVAAKGGNSVARSEMGRLEKSMTAQELEAARNRPAPAADPP